MKRGPVAGGLTMVDTHTITRSLDRRGKTITISAVFDAGHELEQMREGELLELVTEDFEPFEHDLAAWCRAMVISPDGLEVHLFIQGPAVRILKRNHRPRLSTWWARPFSRFAARGVAATGHLPPQEKHRQLHGLGARIYMCAPSMQHFKVDPDELIFDDLPMIEYLSFVPVMERAGVQIYV
jgi:predicted peroxiredoxin